jgi:hypothetical protein
MAIGEIFLAAFLGMLFTRLTSPEFLKFARREGIWKKADKWRGMLLKVQEVLDDAEEKQLTEKAVKIWLDDLRDLAYDVEDLLDEFATESLRSELMAAEEASTSKVRRIVSTTLSFTKISASASKFNPKMRSKMKEVSSRLDGMVKQRIELGLGKMSGGRRTSTDAWQKPPSASVPNEPVIYGRDGDKKKIIDLLLTEEANHDDTNFHIVPIVGMGGIGKTTLAQHVFQDGLVKERFGTKAWACVSDDFDVMRISKAILESVTSHPCDLKEYNQVQVKLREALDGKKFLLVLDDVWNKNYGLWVALKTPFAAGAPGSKIILTTRDADVALMVGPTEYHCLKPLSDQDCWSVFVKHAFENRDLGAQTNLQSVCERIVTKCKGLPLAARTLGGLLRTKQREDEWEDILNSKIWDLSDSQSDILPVLRLSYYHLPSHLKRCFTYSALIPKDFEFEEKDLVLLWMAEGLVPQQVQNKQMEDMGAEYFRDLVSRSIFQVANCDESRFVMHDLVSDLAQWAAGDTCFQLGNDLNAIKQFKVSKRARHSSYIRGWDGIRKFEVFHTTKRLRTFLPLPSLLGHNTGYLTSHVPFDLLPELEFLRVLSLSGYCIDTLPNSIGDLKHLRFLNLSFSAIRNLPQSVCSLYNLQTLLLKGCCLLEGLPSKLGSLINLRHLDITSASSIKAMPMGIEKLTNLQTLSNFVLGKDKGSRLSSLVNLKSLRGTLCITGLENVIDAREAMEANIKDINNLEVLLLEWSPRTDNSRNEKVDKDVLDDLRPHGKVKELTINCYAGLTFPTWVGNPSFSSIFLLRLENCTKCTSLPPLGLLPSLKNLSIVSLTAVKKVGPEFYGQGCSKPFPVLETLLFKNMQEWEEWIPCGVGSDEFPLLNELSVKSCPNLCKKLPPSVPSLEKLVIKKCEKLVVLIHSLPKLCKMVINGCKEVVYEGGVYLRSLNSMTISNISKLTYLAEGFIQPLAEVQELEVANCMELASLYENGVALAKQLTSLLKLEVRNCPQVVSLMEGEVPVYMQQQLANCKLESLTFSTCESLKKLPQWVHSLVSLKELKIQYCPRLLSFPEAGLPSTMRIIEIVGCNALTPLPAAVTYNMMCLEQLRIENCESLISFGRIQLPPTLKKLEIRYCENLLCLLDDGEGSSSKKSDENTSCSGNNSSLLEYLYVGICNSLTSIGELPSALKYLQVCSCSKLKSLSSRDKLPAGLKHLAIDSCENLESMPDRFQDNMSLEHISIWFCFNLRSVPEGLHKLCHLREISIWYCPALVSFAAEGLPINLRRLFIIKCDGLKAIPDHMHNLMSLEELSIYYCPDIVSFPEEGFPTSLTYLATVDLKICELLFNWGMHKLSALRTLIIQGGFSHISFPSVDMGVRLPSALNRLSIEDFPNLEYLSYSGFQNLSSLERLSISDCPKLTSFPGKGLPSSLLELRIRACPLLVQQIKGRVKEWLKIRHIPYINIDGKVVSDPATQVYLSI